MKTSKHISRTIITALLIATSIFTFSACNNKSSQTCQHQWIEATCTEPKICSKCNTTEGTANGHTEGEWVVTSESTLVYYGTEILSCSVCNEIIETRSTSKKKPKVQDTSFNFADKEFIDWINNNSKMQINKAELGLFDDQYAWTSYLMETPDKESGVIVFAHESVDTDSNIRSMLFLFDDYTTSIAIASAIGKGIDSKFDDAKAAISILFDDIYTSCGMSLIKFEDLFDGYDTIIGLAPDGVLS